MPAKDAATTRKKKPASKVHPPVEQEPARPSGGLPDPSMLPTWRRMARRSEKVAQSIAREIVRDLSGLSPGTVLPSESSMLERYNVSRGSLREALRILEVQGLIAIKPGPGGGPMFLGPDSLDLGKTQTLFFHLLGARYTDLLDALVRIEPMMARMAAEQAAGEQVESLRPFLAKPVEEAQDTDSYRNHSDTFHGLLAYACGNPVLTLLAQSLRDIVMARIGPVVFSDSRDREAIIKKHGAVAEAIFKGKPDLAERLMREHLADFRDRVLAHKASLVNEKVDWH